MTDGHDFPLYGRDAAINLVREFLAHRPTPVVIITGPPGCGKSTLLKDLDRRAKGRVPHAMVNCAAFGGRGRELLALLAFELNRGSGRYGTVPFPRLITGLMALRVPLGDIPATGDRDAARDRMRKALEDRAETAKNLQDTVQEVLNAGVQAVGAQPDWIAAALDLIAKAGPPLVLGWLVGNRTGRRLVLGKGQDWYGTQDPDAGHDAIDALIELNRKAAGSVPDDQSADAQAVATARREAADLLWDAFLADLDVAFARRPAQNWSYGPLVLLNRADDGPGALFLDELVKARTRRESAGLSPDPLLVVAASRGPLIEAVAPGTSLASLVTASAGRLRPGKSAHPDGQRWYPVLLDNLSAADVAGLARSLGLRWETGGTQDTALYRYTLGHAGTSYELLAAMAATGQNDLATVLDRPAPGSAADGARRPAGQPLADQLLAQLMTGVPDRVTENLVTCSAGRNKEAALSLAQVNGLLSGEEANEELLNPAFWGEDQALHPVLRRLLLRRLAGRPALGSATWATVHDLLGRACASDRDEAGLLYHSLARGDVQEVATWLAAARTTMGAREWLAMIESVTTAPNSLATGQRTGRYVEKLTGEATWSSELATATGQLVAAMWLDADPLSAPARADLHILARDALRQIARIPGGREIAVLHEYARRRFGDDADWRSQEVTAVAAPTRRDVFDPPRSATGIARARRRKLGAVALALVVAASIGTVVYRAVGAPNSCGQTVAPFQLVTDGGECVGVTDATTGYYFDASDPVAVSLQQLIGRANEQAEQSGDYLTIALVDTLTTTASPEEDVSPARIQDKLRGAYIALENANNESTSPLPVKIRLVLANVGSAEQGWQQVADQLAELSRTNGSGRLIAIAGMGVSVTQTAKMAHQLGAGGAGIPMFGAVTTGDTLDATANPYLYRVVPSAHQEIRAMIPYLERKGEPLAKVNGKGPQIAVVEDANATDLYKQSMNSDFDVLFPDLTADATHQYSYIPIPEGVPPSGQFATIAGDLCQTSPPVVLYEGRESVLGLFVQQLNGDSACNGKPINIITASDANALPASLTHDTEGGANVTVCYADIELHQASKPFTVEYENLADKITGPVNPLPPADMNHPWMFATYDAVTAAWTDISQMLNPPGTDTPKPSYAQITPVNAAHTANNFDNQEDHLVGATGIPLWFTTQHDLAQPEIPIVEITSGQPPHVLTIIGTAAAKASRKH